MYEEGGLIMFSFLFEFTYGISIASGYYRDIFKINLKVNIYIIVQGLLSYLLLKVVLTRD